MQNWSDFDFNTSNIFNYLWLFQVSYGSQLFKGNFKKECLPIKLVECRIETFQNKKISHTPVALTADEKEFFIILPYFSNISLSIRTSLQNSINKDLPFCKTRLFLCPRHVLVFFFGFKNKVPFNLRSNVVQKFFCGRWNGTYYGETCRHLNVRIGEFSAVSTLTRKKLEPKTAAAVKVHMLFCDHISLEYFKILPSSISEFHLNIT